MNFSFLRTLAASFRNPSSLPRTSLTQLLFPKTLFSAIRYTFVLFAESLWFHFPENFSTLCDRSGLLKRRRAAQRRSPSQSKSHSLRKAGVRTHFPGVSGETSLNGMDGWTLEIEMRMERQQRHCREYAKKQLARENCCYIVE